MQDSNELNLSQGQSSTVIAASHGCQKPAVPCGRLNRGIVEGQKRHACRTHKCEVIQRKFLQLVAIVFFTEKYSSDFLLRAASFTPKTLRRCLRCHQDLITSTFKLRTCGYQTLTKTLEQVDCHLFLSCVQTDGRVGVGIQDCKREVHFIFTESFFKFLQQKEFDNQRSLF